MLLPAALLVLFLALRLPGLGRYVTTDEALWLRRSANFYLAVSNGDWANTYQSPHPGVVTQWAGAAGFWLEFPDYNHVGSDAIHDTQLLQLMENRGINPMQVLAAGRLVLVLVHAAAFIACWPFARRLLGMPAAALGMALLAFDPLVIAHQRLLHLDGLLASFMLLALLAFLDYLHQDRWQSLLIAAIATGLAWLTKTPALFLLPVFAAIYVYFWWTERKARQKRRMPLWMGFSAWLIISILVVFILFPALWSNPLGIPIQIVGYALGSAGGEYSGPVYFNGVIYPEGDLGVAGWIFYPLVLLWRGTPLVLIGIALAIWNFFPRKTRRSARHPVPKTAVAANGLPDLQISGLLFIFSLAFILFMTIAGKKFDRYLLPVMPPLILLAGWGWVQLAARMKWFLQTGWRPIALFTLVGALQLGNALPTYPYYLSYYDPLMGGSTQAPQTMMLGWGEGLDQAADYINHQPDMQPGDAAAWYSVSFNLMTSAPADDIPVALELSQPELEALMAKKYLVIYIHQWQRGTPQNLLDRLQGLDPEYRVMINGIEYVRVYHLDKEAQTMRPHGDGVYLVGVTIAPGRWRSTANQDGDCYWARRKYDGILLDNHYGASDTEILISPTDYEVEFDGCGVWVYVRER
jgi:hypothetical protein